MADKTLVVLWVDEELSRDRPLRVELRRRGARVLMARSLERAFELSELFAVPVVVLFDETLAAHFRSAFPAAEIILLTSGRGGVLESAWDCSFRLAPARRGNDAGPARRRVSGATGTWSRAQAPARDGAVRRRRSGDASRPVPVAPPARIPAEAALRSAGSARDDSQVAPDLAILDVTMPGLDGCELARQIRSVYRNLIPLVMLSARSSGAEIAAGYNHGANAYLSKPCPPDRLMDVVDYYAGDLDIEEFEALASGGGEAGGGRSMGVVRSEVNP